MTKIYVFPGQGSQKKGMGAELFEQFPEQTVAADAVLGYSIRELCVEDPTDRLNQTAYTQPALYAVSALTYLKKRGETGRRPDFVAGHSVGEYAALFAAGAFDFVTGLKLVQRRGALMNQASGGGMAAVIGLSSEQIRQILDQGGLGAVDVANLNTPAQTVVSGLQADVQAAQKLFKDAGARAVLPLKVSGAFHSRYMEPAKAEFESLLAGVSFAPLQIPVISNFQARPYEQGEILQNLANQITHPVRWTESIEYLLRQTEPVFEEIGPGAVLTGLIRQIKAAA